MGSTAGGGAGGAPDGGAVLQRTVLRRALAAGEPGRLHIRFHAAVLDRYRAMAGAELVRTSTVGRIAVAGRWSLDVGIVADGAAQAGVAAGGELHLPVQDLLERLPQEEWPHWIEHAVAQPASEPFLKMRLTAAACIDDGDTEPW